MTLAKSLAFWLTIPIDVALVAWILLGRGFFGVLGWMFVLLLPVGVLLLVALGVTAVLAIRQHRPAEGYLTTPQFASLTGLWIALAGMGLFVTDTDDVRSGSASAFTVVAETASAEASSRAFEWCGTLAVGLYLVLLVLLINGQAGRQERQAVPTRAPS